jgi:hypothetical protein
MHAVLQKAVLLVVALLTVGVIFQAFTLERAVAAGPAPRGQNCRLEKQCRWVNFRQICTYVRVCR